MSNNVIHITKQLKTYLLAGLVVLLPFLKDINLIFPTQSAKFFLFSFLVIALASIFLLEVLLQSNYYPFKITSLDIILTVFVFYIGTNVLLNIYRFGLPDRFIELAGLSFLYLLLRRFDFNEFKIIFIALLLSATAQSIYGNLQLYGLIASNHSLFKITGGFFNPGPYAGYLAIIFPMALILYLYSTSNIKEKEPELNIVLLRKPFYVGTRVLRFISLMTLITIVLVLPSTRSRAAWLAVILSSSYILINKYKIPKIVKNRFNSGLVKIALIVFSIFFIIIIIYGLYTMKKDSSDGRLLIWKVSLEMIRQKPLLGYGYNRFEANYMNFQARYFHLKENQKMTIVADNTTRAFNEYLQITAENGIIGLLIVLAIAWSCFFTQLAYKNILHKPFITMSRMSLLAYGIFAFFSYPLEIIPVKLCICICLAWIATNQKSISVKTIPLVVNARSLYPIQIMVSVTGLALLLLLSISLNNKYKTCKKWKQAYTTYLVGAYETSASMFQKLYNPLKFKGEYLLNYGKACSMANENIQAVKVLTRSAGFLPNTIVFTAMGDSYKAMGKVKEAEQAYIKAAYMLPDRFYPKYLLAKLYNETGEQSKACAIANELLTKKVKIESKAIEKIKEEMKLVISHNQTDKNDKTEY